MPRSHPLDGYRAVRCTHVLRDLQGPPAFAGNESSLRIRADYFHSNLGAGASSNYHGRVRRSSRVLHVLVVHPIGRGFVNITGRPLAVRLLGGN